MGKTEKIPFRKMPGLRGSAPVAEKVRPFVPVLFAAVFFCGCFSAPANNGGAADIPLPEPPPEERREILGFGAGVAVGYGSRQMPEWVERYLAGGSPLVEEMPEFQDSYVFVREDEGASLAALERLAGYYDPEKDFPRLAALRVLDRLAVMGGSSPAPELGQYQQAAVRSVADAAWIGAVKAGVFPLRIKTTTGGTEREEREMFLFLTLVVMDRALFQGQLEDILWRQAENPGTGREQAAMIRRIGNGFYAGF